ncbi:hypothetical protein CBM2586_B80003 [Cupriavidus phytorum]|uniref:Uncharacterized protein n=1 Tax=Cupriavidus taiwanensis TaxID=164546 RepID=A0A375CLW9_9BURK|nr:hypothetical protein CBM2586_B80003 [Cupriavidus taiwanensis]
MLLLRRRAQHHLRCRAQARPEDARRDHSLRQSRRQLRLVRAGAEKTAGGGARGRSGLIFRQADLSPCIRHPSREPDCCRRGLPPC